MKENDMKSDKKTKYLGWSNYETWNVMLWINNTYELYSTVDYILKQASQIPTYAEVIHMLGLENSMTGDGIHFLDKNLNHNELNETLRNIH